MQNVIDKILCEIYPPEIFEFGYAVLTGLLHPKYVSFGYGISVMKKLDDAVIDEIRNGPTPRYYQLYLDVNAELNRKLNEVSKRLTGAGIRHRIVPATVVEEELPEDYIKTLRIDVSHKMIATRAGLGWIGKTDLFVSKRFGPRVRLSSILLDTPVAPANPPIDESLCGACRVCVDACPAHAANGKLWNISTERSEFFDAFKCRENCRKMTKANVGIDETVCGICISVCPKGKKN